MRLFKPSYKDRQGKACKTQAWYVELRIAGKRRRVPGYSDKGATAAFGRKLERLAELRGSGGGIDAELSRWIDELQPEHQVRLADLGLVDSKRLSAREGRHAVVCVARWW